MKTTPKLLHNHLRPLKWYNDLFDEITKKEADWWKDDLMKLATEPKPDALNDMRKILLERKKKVTDQEVWDANHSMMMFYSIIVSQAVIQMQEKKRKKKIKEWRDRDKAKDERILNTKPLRGIKCPVCKSIMKYQWSELHDRGTLKKPDEQVIFFYECSKKCKRKIMFEDGTPWISKERNLCPVCSSERTTTITKDNQGKMYFIYECQKCGSRQVEKEYD